MIGGFLGMVIIVPALIAYILGLAFSLDITIVRDTFPLLLSVIALRSGDYDLGRNADPRRFVAVAQFAHLSA